MELLFLQFPMWGMYGCFLHEYLGRRESKKEREIK